MLGGAGGVGMSDREVVLEKEEWKTGTGPSQGPSLSSSLMQSVFYPPHVHLESLLAAAWHNAVTQGPPSPTPNLVEKGEDSLPSPHWPENILLQTKNLNTAKRVWWGWRG